MWVYNIMYNNYHNINIYNTGGKRSVSKFVHGHSVKGRIISCTSKLVWVYRYNVQDVISIVKLSRHSKNNMAGKCSLSGGYQ